MIDPSTCFWLVAVLASVRFPSHSCNLDDLYAVFGLENHRWSPGCSNVHVRGHFFFCPRSDCGIFFALENETCSPWTCSADPGYDFWT